MYIEGYHFWKWKKKQLKQAYIVLIHGAKQFKKGY